MIDYDEFDTLGMDDIGKASVEYVQGVMRRDFGHIFGVNPADKDGIEPTHVLVDVDWFESNNPKEVYPLLVCEAIEDIPNNLVCLCPPFNKEKYL